MIYAKILIPAPKIFLLDYIASDDLELDVGELVIVPFRNKEITGIVWQIINTSEVANLKGVKAKADISYKYPEHELNFIKKTSDYYLAELGSIAKLSLPVDISSGPIKVKTQDLPKNFNLPQLSPEQNSALEFLNNSNKPVLVKGVTGSGKTEVYFHLTAEALARGEQVLILLPEIALSTQIIKRFYNRFGFEPIVWNSTVTIAQKRMILRGIMTGTLKAVIGARSALFLPYANLKLIVVDEEHDTSYKQDDGILYHARDMAVLRGNLSNAKVLLCSATPSIETLYNVEQGKYDLVKLQSRYQEASMPDVKIVDMRTENLPRDRWISEVLKNAIIETLQRGNQVLLFLNRRGYSPLVLCKTCGYRFTCSACSAWLVMHKSSAKLSCHHCGKQTKIPSSCPDCHNSDSLCPCGPGVERIAEEIGTLFPNARIALVSKDYTSEPKELEELLTKMEGREIDILIGTQIITKGHHFPNLTLVGVIDADLGLSSSDLRSTERTYQLLHQVSGRAGREKEKGAVLLQTYYPDNPVITALQNYDEANFIKCEFENRMEAEMPPFTKMASIILTGKNEAKTNAFAKYLVSIAPASEAKILGPAQGLMAKLSGRYRYRILIITQRQFNVQKYLHTWMKQVKVPSYLHLKIDIDPQSFY